MSKSEFVHYKDRPQKLTADFAKKEYGELLGRLPAAENSKTAEKWIGLYQDWKALESYLGSEASRAYYAYSQDMSNKTLEAQEKYFREKIAPVIDQPEHQLAKVFLASRHKKAIARHFGPILIEVYEIALKPLDPINTKLGIKTGNLGASYNKLIAGATIKVRGEEMNLSKARSITFSAEERDLRKEAYLATGDWFLSHHKQLAGIYGQMVKARNQMGRNLKFKNYLPLAYLNRGRMGYNQKDVAAFRKLVLRYLVPVLEKEFKKRAHRMGLSNLQPWDLMYDPVTSLPMGSAPVTKQLDNASRLFKKLSPVLSRHFEKMRKLDLIDLETRPNKQAGGYCTEFTDENKVLIFCNSTGESEDIRTLVHEMGHAFQFWESQGIESLDLRHGTAELAEIYSMGMEFLSLPYITEFFSPQDSLKFAKNKWLDSLYTICYVCIVDEFQHWVYEKPKATPSQRDKIWVDLYKKYLPGVDFAGYEKYAKTRWYAQQHIFVVPFYYIDYALAETIAMQFGQLAQTNHKKTMEKYLDLCKIGGTKSFLGALKSANLRSPFDSKLIKDLRAHLEKVLA